jgi:hypothetical protein
MKDPVTRFPGQKPGWEVVPMYLLTDVGRVHYWLGKRGFVRIAEAADYPDAVPCFFSAAAAQARVRALVRRGCHLRVAYLGEPDPALPAYSGHDGGNNGQSGAAAEFFSDLGRQTTFTYTNGRVTTLQPLGPVKHRARPAAGRGRAKKKPRLRKETAAARG